MLGNRSRHRILSAIVGLALVVVGEARADTIYSNDFETNTAGFNSISRTSLPTDGLGFGSPDQSQYLGRFANDPITLDLTGLTVGATYQVGFDLFIGASWDGNDLGFGPDRWRLTADGTALVDATFSVHAAGEISDPSQTFSDATPTGPGSFARFTGADVSKSTGGVLDRYGIYYFGHGAGNPDLSFTATSGTASLVFTATGLSDPTGVNEFWAIDNVVVTGPGAVPEPSSIVMVGIGALALIGYGPYRRRPRHA